MSVNYINLSSTNDTDKDVLDIINRLSVLEDRKPHDSLRRLIVDAGQQRIKELSAPSEMNSPSVSEKENITKSEPVCQG
jgi:hypothetical protein